MKHYITRIAIASLFAVAFFVSNSQAALNAYLQIKGQTNGKTYRCTVDASGKFSCPEVEPGLYDLVVVCDGKGDCPSSIEISSFSWGVSNSGSSMTTSGASGKSTPVTRSNISNNRTATSSSVTSNGMRVACGDVDGDGVMDMTTSPVSFTVGTPSSSGKVVIHDISVTKACSPSGWVKPSYDLKSNVK